MTSHRPVPSPWPTQPAWAEVDLDAISQNVRSLKKAAGGAQLMAVVKANAYGHGAVAVAAAALQAGAGYLGVASVDEGAQLREGDISAPILLLGPTSVADAERVVAHQLTATVNSRQLALALARFASEGSGRCLVHLKVDTGLHRSGLPPAELIPLAESLRQLPSLTVEGLFTHFATADEADKEFTYRQYRVLLEVSSRLPWIPLRHASNTAAVIDLPEMALEMVRCGIGVYGCYPSREVSRRVPLRPALTLKSRLVRVSRLAPGEGVGYGLTWRAARPSRVGLLPCGYADGYPRLLSNCGRVLIGGHPAPVVGRVSMDSLVVDLTDLPGAEEGGEAVLIGRQGVEEIPADEVADAAGTISYEILTGIAPRLPRLYMRGGQVVAVQTLRDPFPVEVRVSAPH